MSCEAWISPWQKWNEGMWEYARKPWPRRTGLLENENIKLSHTNGWMMKPNLGRARAPFFQMQISVVIIHFAAAAKNHRENDFVSHSMFLSLDSSTNAQCANLRWSCPDRLAFTTSMHFVRRTVLLFIYSPLFSFQFNIWICQINKTQRNKNSSIVFFFGWWRRRWWTSNVRMFLCSSNTSIGTWLWRLNGNRENCKLTQLGQFILNIFISITFNIVCGFCWCSAMDSFHFPMEIDVCAHAQAAPLKCAVKSVNKCYAYIHHSNSRWWLLLSSRIWRHLSVHLFSSFCYSSLDNASTISTCHWWICCLPTFSLFCFSINNILPLTAQCIDDCMITPVLTIDFRHWQMLATEWWTI